MRPLSSFLSFCASNSCEDTYSEYHTNLQHVSVKESSCLCTVRGGFILAFRIIIAGSEFLPHPIFARSPGHSEKIDLEQEAALPSSILLILVLGFFDIYGPYIGHQAQPYRYWDLFSGQGFLRHSLVPGYSLPAPKSF